MDATMDSIMTVPEVAKCLKMSSSKVYYLVQRREIPHIRIGRNVRSEVVTWKKWLLDKYLDDFAHLAIGAGLTGQSHKHSGHLMHTH